MFTVTLSGKREEEEAVMTDLPSSELVVRLVRTDILPAGMVTYAGTETRSGSLDESETIVSEEEMAGCPEAVISPTSNELYVRPSVGKVPGSSLRCNWVGAQLVLQGTATVTIAPFDPYPVEDAVITAWPEYALVSKVPVA